MTAEQQFDEKQQDAVSEEGEQGERSCSAIDWKEVDSLLSSAAVPYDEALRLSEEGKVVDSTQFVSPGVELLVALEGDIIYHRVVGCRSLLPNPSRLKPRMIFDVASLTKALVTTTLAMQLVDKGRLNLDRRLSSIFQTFATHGKEQMTPRHLLNHSSGYPAYAPFYKRVAQANRAERAGVLHSRAAQDMVLREIFRMPNNHLPGKVSVYSDIGFMLLGAAIEHLSGGNSLSKLAQKQIFQPLRLGDMGFIDIFALRQGGVQSVSDVIVPTAKCPWRNKIMLGEVHDDNAWVLGGVAGHAGLFASARSVHQLAQHLLSCWHGKDGIVSKECIRHFWSRDKRIPGATWALGWDTPSETNSSAGRFFSPSAVGHLGYTGCSIWIEPEPALEVILLTNRVHPSTENKRILDFRPAIHDAVMQALGFAP